MGFNSKVVPPPYLTPGALSKSQLTGFSLRDKATRRLIVPPSQQPAHHSWETDTGHQTIRHIPGTQRGRTAQGSYRTELQSPHCTISTKRKEQRLRRVRILQPLALIPYPSLLKRELRVPSSESNPPLRVPSTAHLSVTISSSEVLLGTKCPHICVYRCHFYSNHNSTQS